MEERNITQAMRLARRAVLVKNNNEAEWLCLASGSGGYHGGAWWAIAAC